MNALDIIILICFIPALVQGITKGFISQVIALVSIILGAYLAFKFSNLVCGWLAPVMTVSPAVLHVIAFTLILIVVVVGLFLLGRMLEGVLKMAMLGWVDKILGIAFAILKAALIIGLVIILFNTLNARLHMVKDEVLDKSVMYTAIKNFAYIVFPYLKSLLFKQ